MLTATGHVYINCKNFFTSNKVSIKHWNLNQRASSTRGKFHGNWLYVRLIWVALLKKISWNFNLLLLPPHPPFRKKHVWRVYCACRDVSGKLEASFNLSGEATRWNSFSSFLAFSYPSLPLKSFFLTCKTFIHLIELNNKTQAVKLSKEHRLYLQEICENLVSRYWFSQLNMFCHKL